MKKVFALVLCMALALGLFAGLTTGAEEVVFEGVVVNDLTWANGTYYGNAVGNGSGKYIYTTLKLEEGEKVQFERGGVWNLWVYPVIDGVATGEYRGGNGTGKISNGEILTFAEGVDELRITVYIEGGAAATVESDAFKTMDIKFYRIAPNSSLVKDLTWANGTYYGNAVGNGSGKYIYTTLKLEEGEKVQFERGGVWNLWVYPVIDGVATGEYRGGNSTGKISNGEILTFAEGVDELRITVYIEGGAAATVESEVFKTMDIRFFTIAKPVDDGYKTGILNDLVWKPGAQYDTFKDLPTTRRYTEIAVKEGDKLYVDMPSDSWVLWLYAFDETGYIKYYDKCAGNMEYSIEAVNGRVPTKVYVTAVPNPDRALKDDEWNFDFQISRNLPIPDYKEGVLELTWEKGAMYDSFKDLPVTRRYTEIAVKGGDKLYFKMPSENWTLWIYAYDDAGYIKYYDKCEIDSVYTIEAVSGRTPTKVYVTAVPNPDRALEDNQWNFDFQISRNVPFAGQEEEEGNKPDASGLIWNKGAFYDTPSPNTALATTRRYTVMEVAAGDVIKFNIPTSEWNIWVYPADEVGSINYFQAKNGQEYEVKAIGGRTPTTLRITAIHNPDSSISDALWKTFNVTIVKTTVTPPSTENPGTSDFSIVLPAVAMICSLTLVSGVVILRKKRKI